MAERATIRERLSVHNLAALRALEDRPQSCHWAFAPQQWAMLHRLGLIETNYARFSGGGGSLTARLTDKGREAIAKEAERARADG